MPFPRKSARKVRTRRQCWYIFLGADDRVSTSQVPFALWTVAFAYVLLANGFHDGVYPVGTLDPRYLLLFGFPAVAAVSARAITVELVSGGVVSKDPPEFKRKTPVTAVKDIVSNDQGDIDLGDTQYFIVTLVTLTAFFIAFSRDPTRLPTLPYALVGLASASAAVYVAKKASAAVYLVKKTSAARTGPAHPVDPRDASYRYGRLLHAPLRPSQLAAVAAAAVVPLVVGTLLVGGRRATCETGHGHLSGRTRAGGRAALASHRAVAWRCLRGETRRGPAIPPARHSSRVTQGRAHQERITGKHTRTGFGTRGGTRQARKDTESLA